MASRDLLPGRPPVGFRNESVLTGAVFAPISVPIPVRLTVARAVSELIPVLITVARFVFRPIADLYGCLNLICVCYRFTGTIPKLKPLPHRGTLEIWAHRLILIGTPCESGAENQRNYYCHDYFSSTHERPP